MSSNAAYSSELGDAIQQGFRITPEKARPALHIGIDDLPFVELPDGSKVQVLHVDLNQGLWVVRTRFRPGYSVQTHYHTGPVFAVTTSGSWYYKESPEDVNRAGSYLFEPAHSVHTLMVSADNTEDTEVWFAIYGCNVNVDDDHKIIGILDAKTVMDLYRAGCQTAGASCDKMIVVGE